jgi:hypothetical protein
LLHLGRKLDSEDGRECDLREAIRRPIAHWEGPWAPWSYPTRTFALVWVSLRGAPTRTIVKFELLDTSRKVPSSPGICIPYLSKVPILIAFIWLCVLPS